MKKRRKRRKRSASVCPTPTLVETPFRELVQKDKELKEMRERYATQPADKRRRAAEWTLDSEHASMLLAQATGDLDMVHPTWHETVASLAIDPEFPAAILAVGSLEYQYGRPEEAMTLFLQLTAFPADAEDLIEVIDKAGDFLIDQDDCINAEKLYAAAVASHPQFAIFHIGLGYCVADNGRKDESLVHHQRAVELEPDNYLHLNDLGFALLESGRYDEAERVLQRAVQLAPPDYELAKGNLKHLNELRSRPEG